MASNYLSPPGYFLQLSACIKLLKHVRKFIFLSKKCCYRQTVLFVQRETNEITLSFIEKLSKSFGALQTLEKGDTSTGLVMTTIKKLSHVELDVVCIDDEWEQWGMENPLENLEKWLKSNKPEEQMYGPPDMTKERNNSIPKEREELQHQTKADKSQIFCFVMKAIGENACRTYDALQQRNILTMGNMGTENINFKA